MNKLKPKNAVPASDAFKEEMPREEPCFFCGKQDGKHKSNCQMVKTAEDS